MTSTEATRYSVQRDSDGWHVVAPDGTVVRTCDSRDEARHAAKQARLTAAEHRAAEVTSRDWDTDPEATDEATEEATQDDTEATEEDEQAVEELAEQIAQDDDEQQEDGDRPEVDPEHEAFLAMTPAEQSTELVRLAREAQDGYAGPDGLGARGDAYDDADAALAAWAAEGGASTKPEPEPQPEPTAETEAPKATRTGESVVARKLVEGQRIQLRGIGPVRVTGVAKIRGQQKVLVRFRTDADEQGERELWINSRYSIVA